MDENLNERLAKVEERSKSNSHRIEELEADQKAVTELAISVRTMAAEQGHMKDDLSEVKTDVKSLTEKSGRRWDGLVDKIVWLLAGGLITFALAAIGINV